MKNETRKKKGNIWLYCTAIGLAASFWSLVTPLFEFPDEQVHLETVNYVADHGKMQPWDTPDVTPEMLMTQKLLGTERDGNGNNKYTYHPNYHVDYTDTVMGKYEQEIRDLNRVDMRNTYVKDEGAQYPPAYYIYTSWWHRLASGSDIITRSFVVRLASLPLTVLMAWYTYKIGYLLFRKKKLAQTLAFLTMLQPMMSFISAGTNSDNLHNLLFFALIYYCLRIVVKGMTIPSIVGAVAAIALDIYTKPQGFVGAGIFALAVIIAVLRSKNWKMLGVLAVAAIGVTIIAWPELQQYLAFALIGNTRNLSFVEYLRFSENKLLAQNVVWYWGVFKWLGVVLPPIYWRVANRVVLLAAAGCVIYVWKVMKKRNVVASPLATFYMFLVALMYALSIFWADWQHHKNTGYSLGIQARYFFPTIPAHLSLLMIGILTFGWTAKLRIWLRRSLVVLFVWLQLGGLWRLLSVYYDISSLKVLITQLSQYKPDFLKGNWWYLWGTIYLGTLVYVVFITLKKSSRVRMDSGVLSQKKHSNTVTAGR